MRTLLRLVTASEEGHAEPLGGIVIASAGVLMLAIGANSDTGWLTIAGGVLGAVGFLAWEVLRHTRIDYDVYRRLEKLEKKQ